MQLTRDPNIGNFHIQSYEPGQVVINETRYRQSLIITPNQIITDWPVAHLSSLTSADLLLALITNPQVLILGTGNKLAFPPQVLLTPAIEKQIGVEVMTTIAACRTYNVLTAEGRNVVAALIIES